jgi:hypothetical protein
VVLVEEVIGAIKKDQTIRIIDPALWGLEMLDIC